jgi:hypothetical protein
MEKTKIYKVSDSKSVYNKFKKQKGIILGYLNNEKLEKYKVSLLNWHKANWGDNIFISWESMFFGIDEIYLVTNTCEIKYKFYKHQKVDKFIQILNNKTLESCWIKTRDLEMFYEL